MLVTVEETIKQTALGSCGLGFCVDRRNILWSRKRQRHRFDNPKETIAFEAKIVALPAQVIPFAPERVKLHL